MSLEEELLMDEQEMRREVSFIRKQLPIDMKDHYADDKLLSWVLEAVADYYYDSGVLESEADEVDIDMEAVASYVCARAAQEGRPPLDPQEVRFIAEADLDFQEQNL